MKSRTWAIATLSVSLAGGLALLGSVPTVRAEDLALTQQLLSTKQCAGCELSNAGLVYAKLPGANLVGANLVGANLSRADLQGADLRGANLTGASLYGANLAGARLDGAVLRGTDLRSAYVAGISHEGAVMEQVFWQGAIGIPSTVASAEEFYRWAVEDAHAGNHPRAVENFTQALSRKEDLPQAYLGRAVSRLQTTDKQGAIADTQRAEALFKVQGNLKGAELAQVMHKQLTAPPPKEQKGNGLGIALLNVVGVVLKVLTMF